MYQGSDLPDVVNESDPYYTGGLPSYNIIADNLIDTATEGIKIGDTMGNEFTGNVSFALLCGWWLVASVRAPPRLRVRLGIGFGLRLAAGVKRGDTASVSNEFAVNGTVP